MNCHLCPNHCCGRHPAIGAPILLPGELAAFSDVITPSAEVNGIQFYRISRGAGGNCRYLDGANLCTIYERRPFECRAYPYIMRAGKTFTLSPKCWDPSGATVPEFPDVDPKWLAAYENLPV